jgi:hypothetical protein
LVVYERGNQLFVVERRSGIARTVLQVTAGAATRAQLVFFEANLKGRVLQEEADLILKYFYGLG